MEQRAQHELSMWYRPPEIAAHAGQPDADFRPAAPSRHQRIPCSRADREKKKQAALFNYLDPETGEILDDLLGNAPATSNFSRNLGLLRKDLKNYKRLLAEAAQVEN